jgi:diguanylate cyclase (GGDEF)-like protein
MAESGPEALEKINRAHYDLVLLDEMMPGTSGLDLLRLLRATYSQSELPVIMVTPGGDGQSAVDALEHGANDQLSQPIDPPVAAARIQAQLNRSRADRSFQEEDSLTGLYNRGYFFSRLTEALQRQPAADGRVAVLLIELDRLRMFDESIGPQAGDRILREAGQRFQDALAGEHQAVDVPPVLLARVADAGFAVLLESAGGVPEAEAVVQRLLSCLDRPLDFPDTRRGRPAILRSQLSLTASVGIAVHADGQASAAELLRDAALALSRAQEEGKERHSRWRIFKPAMRRRAQVRMALAMELQHALERSQLTVFYQPKIHLATRTVIGFEALMRWRHPVHGMIPPADFIPVAEETGLIVPLGSWILRQACRQLQSWQFKFRHDPPLSMNVNLSVKQLADPDLIPGLQRILAETGIPPETLKLELTESTLASEMESAREALSRIQGLHVGLKLDDFGTGYSSLSYLGTLHFDSLKIDRSFINRLETDPESGAIIAAILELARTLHMTVVAEGIETEGQAARLLDLGCEVGQGFLFSRPVAADLAEKLLGSAAAA